MSYAMDYPLPVEQSPAAERAAFIRRTYGHLAGAVLAFMCLEYFLLHLPGIDTFIMSLFGSPFSMILLMVGFVGVSHLATMWAQSNTSTGMQYAGLGLYVLAEGIIFLPILFVAAYATKANGELRYPGVIGQAAILTGAVFVGLTLAVLVTGKDYSFLGPVVSIGSMVAMGVILAGWLFGFGLGLFFCLAMVALASASIIYQTSNIMHRYYTNQHVAAALALFASVALLFYYILRIAMIAGSSRD